MPQDLSFPHVVLAVLVGVFGLASIGMWAWIAQALQDGRQPLPYQARPAASPNPLVATVAFAYSLVLYSGQVVAGVYPQHHGPSLRAAQVSCLINVLIVSLLLAMLAHPSSTRLSDFGIKLGGWRRAAVNGALGFLASLLPVYSIQVLMVLVNLVLPFRNEETQHSFLQLLSSNTDPTAIAWVALAAVMLAPLAEELMFRVIIQGWLQSRVRPALAIAASAILFSAIHGFPDAIGLLPLAVILGYVYYRTHSYLAVIALHALFNAFSLAVVVLLAQPDQAETPFSTGSLNWLSTVLPWGA